MIAKEPIRINKSFNIDSIEVEASTIKIRGYASRMFDANNKYVIDGDGESVNTMGIDLKRMNTGNIPLLYSHSQDKVVGTIDSAEYKADGLVIEATVHKLPNDSLTNYVYEAVKANILSSFSVGIIVKEFDVVDVDGEDYLQLAQSELIETSLVAVPSNPEATFSIMSISSPEDDERNDYKMLISKSAIKEENPKACEEFGNCILKGSNEMEKKALDYVDTLNESWMKGREFHIKLDALYSTIEDNWYAQQWDGLGTEAVLGNIKKAFEDFVKDQTELLDSEGTVSTTKGIKGKEEMVVKEVEPEVTPTVEPEVVPEEVPKVEPEVIPEVVPEKEPKEVIPEKAKADTPEEIVEQPKEVIRTLADLLGDISILNVDDMDFDDLDKVYSTLSDTAEKIEAMVVAQLKEELGEA